MTDNTPYVGYNYDATHGYRLTSVDYPNGRQIDYTYGTTGSADDSLNRLSTIQDDATSQTLAAYSYLGLGTIATEDFQEPEIKLDYSGGNDSYSALDRFGRVLDQLWSNYGNSTTADHYTYTYDQAGNVHTRGNALDTALSETYTYDNLNQLLSATRNDGTIQSWNLSGTGDWNSFTNDGTTEKEPSNGANETTAITDTSNNPVGVQPVYDAAGELTTLPSPANSSTSLGAQYDAWGRLVQVTTGSTTVDYQYDGLGRLVEQQQGSNSTQYYLYAGSQVVETRTTAPPA